MTEERAHATFTGNLMYRPSQGSCFEIVVHRLTDIQTGMLVALLAPLPGAGVRDWSSID